MFEINLGGMRKVWFNSEKYFLMSVKIQHIYMKNIQITKKCSKSITGVWGKYGLIVKILFNEPEISTYIYGEYPNH